MNDLASQMLTAAMNGLNDGERRDLNVEVFRKIVLTCADVATPTGPEPPPMQFLNASYLQPGDLVWQDDCRFLSVAAVESLDDTDVHRVLFQGEVSSWVQSKEPVRVATDRFRAREWNSRRLVFTDETVERIRATHGGATPVLETQS